MKSRIEEINICAKAGEEPKPSTTVRVEVGKGIVGDRYGARSGSWSGKKDGEREITFIEQEAIEALVRDYQIDFSARESRRNIATRDIALNHLVGKQFSIGEARFLGTELCEPCKYLEKVSGKKVRAGLVHRGGLRAKVLQSGELKVGDAIELT